MKRQYLLRLDDACPTMDKKKWECMEEMLDRYGVKPMVGVIPHNEDPQQMIDDEDIFFWQKIHTWEKKGWTIAIHGYNHYYSSEEGLNGLNPMWKYSEFAGLPLDVQRTKIRKGVAMFRAQGINPRFFFAPAHTFDKKTLTALQNESDVDIISDTIALKPYRYGNFIIIPQFCGHCREIKMRGLFTFCLHPSTMKDAFFEQTNLFLQAHSHEFTTFDALNLTDVKEKSFFDKVLSFGYFFIRRIKSV